MLYCLGEEAEDVLTSTNISNDDRKKFDKVVDKIDEYFKVRKNIIFERARFNRRTQQEGEAADEYITYLYSLADNCQYGNLKEEMIRDRLVVRIRDSALSERLQMDSWKSQTARSTARSRPEAANNPPVRREASGDECELREDRQEQQQLQTQIKCTPA